MSQLPLKRSGSGTEKIFEKFHRLANDKHFDAEENLQKISSHYSLLETIYYIIGYDETEFKTQETESLFKLEKIITPDNPKDYISPYLHLISEPTQNTKQVNKLILGTPYIVQHKSSIDITQEKLNKRNFIEKIFHYFGFFNLIKPTRNSST